MGLRALAAVVAALDVLLCVVPRSAGVGHEDRKENTCDQSAGKKAAERFCSEQETDDDRSRSRNDTGNDHLAKSRDRGNTDAGLIIRTAGALQDAGVLTELAADFLDHTVGCLGNGFHRNGREEECQHAADEDTDNDLRSHDVDGIQRNCLRIGYEESQRCQRSGADGKALADGGCRITYRVKFVRDISDALIKSGHLGDTAGVVGDRTVSVDCDRTARCGQHADCCQRDAVQTCDEVGSHDADADAYDRDDR